MSFRNGQLITVLLSYFIVLWDLALVIRIDVDALPRGKQGKRQVNAMTILKIRILEKLLRLLKSSTLKLQHSLSNPKNP